MDEPRIAPSARKHGVSDETIRHALNNPIRSEELDEALTMLTGPDHAGSRYEIGVDAADRPLARRARNDRPTQVPQVTAMPRSIEEILQQADELAARFETHEPGEVVEASSLRIVRSAFLERAGAERRLADAVSIARAEGHSWAAIGAMVGTSGEAARQRYGQPATKR